MVWSCIACTFENDKDIFLSCECCSTPRSKHRDDNGNNSVRQPPTKRPRPCSSHVTSKNGNGGGGGGGGGDDGDAPKRRNLGRHGKKRSIVDVLKPQSASSFVGRATMTTTMTTSREGVSSALTSRNTTLKDEEVPLHVPCDVARHVLPRKMADRLLVLLHQDAVTWKSHPWYMFGKWGRTPRTSKGFQLNVLDGAKGHPNQQDSFYAPTTKLNESINSQHKDGSTCSTHTDIDTELMRLLRDSADHITKLVDDSRPGRKPPFRPTLAFANCYSNHSQSVGAHSDFLGELGPRPIIVGLSLGACRDFVVSSKKKRRGEPIAAAATLSSLQKKATAFSVTVRIPSPHNSAVTMWGECQENFDHSVPACAETAILRHAAVGSIRFSLTYRMSRVGEIPQRPLCHCEKPTELKYRGSSYRWFCAGHAPRGNEQLSDAAPPDPCSFDEPSEWARVEALRLASSEPRRSHASMVAHTTTR